ncbi:hypothetical protein BaRGS_00005568 [Batillaria attramentaria]|uniref:Uncharacterized protein n=1 Tax=Batillaria attramentaria TaxID=370345 RepID=A0ABD0LV96_9CAEN
MTTVIIKKLKALEGDDSEERHLQIIEKLTEQNQPVSQVQVGVVSGLRKELRIEGVLDGKNTGLSFVSLMRQIEVAQKRGYPEREIIDAVIAAIPTGHHLKRFLEVSNFDIEATREILRRHLRQPSATELFAQLSQSVQPPDDSASDFVLRLLDLRERTKLSSAAKDNGLVSS